MTILLLLSSFMAGLAVLVLVPLGWNLLSQSVERGRSELSELGVGESVQKNSDPGLTCLANLSAVFTPLTNWWKQKASLRGPQIFGDLQKNMSRAGITHQLKAEQILNLCFGLACAAGGASFLILGVVGFRLSLMHLILSVGLALIGFALPLISIRRSAKIRVAQMEKHLPFAIEFLALAMEANAAFPQAIHEFCHQMRMSPLAEELDTVLAESNNVGLNSAFERLSQRIGSDVLSQFLIALVDGLNHGHPIKEILFTQADIARQKRWKHAEEAAKSAEAQTQFPLMVSVIGAVLILVIPLVLRVFQSL